MTRDGLRRVLLLAYYFPPLGGAGVQRAVKFAKYLPESGWQPTVLTTRSIVYRARDPSLADELPPGLKVVRAREPRGAMGPAVVLQKLGLTRASRIAAFPDHAVGWIPDALRITLSVIRRERPAVLFSTSAPFSSHLIALAAHRRTGVPWVADFRDEWAANPGLLDDPAIVRTMARGCERAITGAASAVTVAADYFQLDNPSGTPRILVPNGVDEADLVGLDPSPPPDDAFLMSYVGTLHPGQDPLPVLEAIDRLKARGAIDPSRFRLRIVGNDFRAPGRRTFPVPVEQVGYLSHREALREMQSASVLLHYVAPTSRAPAGKLYEYLATGRPILCVARPDGGAAAVVRAADAGPIAAPDNPAAIEQAILSLYKRWSATTGLPDQSRAREWALTNYSRRKLAADLASVLDSAAAGQSG
jgi:glycosyltransferase involved in cell wall biosynthesis